MKKFENTTNLPEESAMTETMTLDQMVENLNSIRATGNGTDIQKALDDLTAACKAQTEKNIQKHITAILSLEADRIAMFTDYINNPIAETVRIKQDNKTGEYALTTGEKQISFMQLEKAFQILHGTKHADGSVEADTSKTLAQDKRYYAMLTYFVDNLTRNIAGDLSEQVKKVSVPTLTSKEEKPVEHDFSGVSVNAMEAQLNALVSTILPADMSVKMRRVDVKALKQAATTEKMMKFRMNDEGRMLNKIFAAIRIRMNDEAYELTSKAKAHKQPKPQLTANENNSEKQETDMSKVPERAEAVPANKKSA